MTVPLRSKAPHRQKREILACLRAHGLTAAPQKDRGRDEIPWGVRFRQVALELGPGFVLFAHFLASRPDLLTVEDVLALEELGPGDLAGTLPWAEDPVEYVVDELGRASSEVFLDFERQPTVEGIFYSDYRARLRGDQAQGIDRGCEVEVRLRRPGLEQALAIDLANLPFLWPAFAGIVGSPFERRRFETFLDTFRRALNLRLDLRAEAMALEGFSKDLVDRESLAVPTVFAALSTPRMVVREALRGRRLEDLEVGSMAGRGRELARRLHLAWLEQALVAGHVPLDTEWIELRDGRLGIVGGRFERLARAARPRLWSYLRHLAGHRPEEAYEAIAGELHAVRRDADERTLRLRLRQLVPFRDGGWSARRDTLGELLVLHWRVVREEGFQPSPALEVLWQGLYQAASQGRRLDVEGDPLRFALEDLRWLAGFRRLHQLADPSHLGDAFESNLAGLLEVPQKIDRLLHMVSGEAGGDLRLQLRIAEDPEVARRRNSLTVAVCVAFLMGSVAVLARRFGGFGGGEAWVEPAAAVAFLGLGVLLLRTITSK